MSRLRRFIEPDSIQHIISRFINEEFRMDTPEIRTNYLERWPPVLARCDWNALAYALMTSHLHHALEAGRATGDRVIRPIHGGFASWLNKAQGRLGPVFADRYKNIAFEGEFLAVLLAYIHNNPVRAGVVDDPADSDWTSHRAYLGDVEAPPWLNVKRGLSLCGYNAAPSGRLAFHEFVCSLSDGSRDDFFTGGSATEDAVRIGQILGGRVEVGSVHVIDRNFHRVPIRVCPEAHFTKPWSGDAARVLQVVAEETNIDLFLLKSRARRRDIVRARRLSLIVWSRYLGRKMREMSDLLSISPAAGSHLLRDQSAIVQLESDAAKVASRCIKEVALPGLALDREPSMVALSGGSRT